ncbi:MAG: SDR family oxidoreductase [Deltaproteobacteria bacterium]|nr:SDR family oxidoreductase [Deltaproteobacteria bacterium]
MKHVLITGGAGFIGSHLCERYLEQGCRVTAIDNFVTGRPENVAHLKGEKAFRLVEHDVSTPFTPSMEKEFGKVDVVMHFACPASPIDFERIPLEIMKVDSYGTFHTLEVARANKARFVIASTSEIYGDPLVHPQTEDYWGNVNTTGKRSCYDETKRFSEASATVYRNKWGVNTGIVRIFNTYGPRMRLDDGRVVPNFCGQALRGQPITVYGTGQQTRSFCFVDDLVEGIMRLTASDCNDPVNIGNPDEYTMLEFAKVVLKAVPGTKSEIVYKPLLHHDDPKQRKPDITRARKVLNGWEPKVSLAEGLGRTLEYFRTKL